MPFNNEFLLPVLALIVWSLVVEIWMYATRIPAMQKAKIHPDTARHPGSYADKLPASTRSVADNFNHLHEQPTVFYALMFFAAMTGESRKIIFTLACVYVGLRIVHTLVQVFSPNVTMRFLVFCTSSIVLMAMTVMQIIRVFS